MSEIEIWNIMHMGLISNAMYFVGMVLMTWLGFRFAAKVREEQNAELIGKILVSAFFCDGRPIVFKCHDDCR